MFKNIHELSFFFNHNFHALIDIPIGLGSKTIFRKVDQFLRNKLSKNFKSSVFNTPNRAAVYAEDYLNSKEINLYETEKSVSIQAWNICPKIKEIDTFLTKHSSAKISLTESHPELCFQELNNQTPLQFKKNCKEGIQERLQILAKFDKNSSLHFNNFLENSKRSHVKKDDIIDSMGLAYCFKYSKELEFIYSSEFPLDEHNIEMKIAYPVL